MVVDLWNGLDYIAVSMDSATALKRYLGTLGYLALIFCIECWCL